MSWTSLRGNFRLITSYFRKRTLLDSKKAACSGTEVAFNFGIFLSLRTLFFINATSRGLRWRIKITALHKVTEKEALVKLQQHGEVHGAALNSKAVTIV